MCWIPATLGWRLQYHLRCRGILGECLAPFMSYVLSCDLLTQFRFFVSVFPVLCVPFQECLALACISCPISCALSDPTHITDG